MTTEEKLKDEIKRLVDYGDYKGYYKQDVLQAQLKGFQQGKEQTKQKIIEVIEKSIHLRTWQKQELLKSIEEI